MPLIPASWEDHQGQPWAKKDKKSTKPYLKTKAKKKKKRKVGVLTQVVESLPSKTEALSLNPSTAH
jgi:hypothetical protein